MISYINYGACWTREDLSYPIRKPHYTVNRLRGPLNKDVDLKKPLVCVDCGKEIGVTAMRCMSCAAYQKRKVERPSRKILKQLIRIKPFVQIGKQFNVSDNSIRKWCDNYNLPRKKVDINKYSDEEWKKI